ncbi:MAG: BNR-4 repeat-containing protein [Planctomycetaceae bacterium]
MLTALAVSVSADRAWCHLTRVSDSVVDPAALVMTSTATYGRAINGASFQVNALQTFAGYQYTAWYTNDATASVMLARRSVSGTTVGAWDAVNTGSRFTNGKGSSDAHNAISFGIAGDGSIHMAWDMHNNNLRYRRTAAGVAASGTAWGAAMFQPEQAFLTPGEATVTSVTYPNFVSKPDGGLLFAIRRGGSGNGDNWLYDYDDGRWHDGRLITSRTGTFTDAFNPASSPSASRNAYWNGYDYGPDGTLFTTWTWRESTNQYANHDICFAASGDGGFTWRNNAGVAVADTTRSLPIRLDSPGVTVATLDRTKSLINQQAQIVMGDGSVHAVMYHRRDDQPWQSGDAAYVPADCSYFDYVRDPLTGTWSRHEIPGLVGTRAAVARSADDTLYAVFVSPGTPLGSINTTNGARGRILTIAAASKAAGWSDWSIVHRDYLRNFADEPRVDAGRLLTSGVLSVYAQENSATSTATGTPLRVIDFVPAAPAGGDGWLRVGGGSWTSAANWSPAVVPNSGTAAATIGFGFMGGAAITLDTAVTLNRLTFLGASGTLAAGGGGVLTFSGSGATGRIESALTITAPISGSFTKSGGGLLALAADNAAGLGGATITVAGGQLMPGAGGTATGGEFGSAATTIVVQPGGQVWMASLTAGTRSFPQTLRLSGSGVSAAGYGAIVNDSGTAVTLAGPVIVMADATIAAINNGTYVLGTGSTGFAEATAGTALTVALAGGTSSLSGTVGVSTLVKQGVGTLRLAAGQRIIDSGTVRVEAGAVDLGGTAERIDRLVLTGGGVTSGTLQAAAYELQSGTCAVVLTGSGGVMKIGAGTATLSGSAVAFTGTTTVAGGVLAITSTAALPGWNVAGRFAVSSGATLSVPASFSDATINTLVSTGNFSADGRLGIVTTATTRALAFGAGGQGGLGLMLNGSGTVTATGSNGYSGGTVLAGGLVRVTAAGGLGSGPVTITGSAARVALGSSVALANDVVVDGPAGVVANGVIQYEGSGTGRMAGGTVTVLASPGSGGVFASTGGGTLVVEGPVVAPTGATVSMRIGTTVFAGGGSYASFFINEGTARLGRANGLSTSAQVTVGASAAATLDLAGYDQSLAGILKGPGAATVGSSSTTRDSVLTLTGSSAYAGTIVDAVGGGTRRTHLVVDGGWLRLTGSSTLTGTTTVRSGTLQVTTARGLAASPVRMLPGGTLAIAGTTTLVMARLAVEGGQVDVAGGRLSIAAGGMGSGALTAALAMGRGDGSWSSAAGITSSSVAAMVAAGADRSLGWVQQGDGSFLIAPAAAGDTNLDGLVDVLDIAAVMSAGLYDSAAAATWATGDVTYDGVVDILDVSEMLGTGLFDTGPYQSAPAAPAASAAPVAAVPEPAPLSAAGVAVLLMITAVRSSACRVSLAKATTARWIAARGLAAGRS